MIRKIRRMKKRTMLLCVRKRKKMSVKAGKASEDKARTYAARSSSRIVRPPISADVHARDEPHGKDAM